MKEINIGPLKLVMSIVEQMDLSKLDPKVIAGINADRREGETFDQAAGRLLADGLVIEALKLQGAKIVARNEDGKETDFFEEVKSLFGETPNS